MLKHGSLFSGIGGFDLAAEWAGWENIFHCEINPFGQKVLSYYWPNSIQYHDITKTDFTIHRGTIDVLTGGFPCQPYSQAGKRLGKEDERHLWPEMLRAIREIQPRWVVGENVRGLITWNGGLVFDEVQADLEAAGYEVLPFLLPASGVNAPHERYRIWFVAYTSGDGNSRKGRSENIRGWEKSNERVWTNFQHEFNINGEVRTTTNSTSDRRIRTRQGIDTEEGLQPRPEQSGQLAGRFEGLRIQRDVTDTKCDGLSRQWENIRPIGSTENRIRKASRFDLYNEGSRISGNWTKWPTQSPVCSRNDGISPELAGITFSKHRNESIKAYGNAIVPQVVYQIFKAINQYEQTK